MSETRSFTAQLRRRALRSDIAGNLWMAFFALILAAWGLFFLLRLCSDCEANPLGAVLVGLLMEGGAAWLLYTMVSGIRGRLQPGGGALSVQIQPYGDPLALSGELDVDFHGETLLPKKLYLGPRWLVYFRDEPIVRRRDDLVWAYVEAVRHRIYEIIPIGTTWYLNLWERSGRGAALELTKAEAEAGLGALAGAAPWLLVGFTEALKESWNNDREDLLAYVDRRKAGPAAP